MMSLEPAMGKKGYPNLFATGETADGRIQLTDRQHPHDLFMELSARLDVDVGPAACSSMAVPSPSRRSDRRRSCTAPRRPTSRCRRSRTIGSTARISATASSPLAMRHRAGSSRPRRSVARARPVSLEHRAPQPRFVERARDLDPLARLGGAGQPRAAQKPRTARTRPRRSAHDGERAICAARRLGAARFLEQTSAARAHADGMARRGELGHRPAPHGLRARGECRK